MIRTHKLLIVLISLGFAAELFALPKVKFNADMSTFSNYDSVTCKHVNWEAKVDFTKKEISGKATWTFTNRSQSDYIRFDTYDMIIHSVNVNGKKATYFLGEFDTEYGSGLVIRIDKKDTSVCIEYTTGSNAKALQWLSPAQTAGKVKPYLFTQCESIQARSLLPCQDVPAIRITYNASLQVPKGMLALMSAKNPIEKSKDGTYNFEMEIPIPSYLIALVIGDIEYKAIDKRCGVYSEPIILAKAAEELSDIPKMMEAAEKIGGPYKWGKYDVLIAPPSFPIGGMENPRLTFATPTILAGDKSLVTLIAHEMAHSWSGNLVTNASWSDIWLNEGFTTYFERRIMESVAGKTYNEMLWELGYQDMFEDLTSLGITNPDTKLRIDLNGRNPESAFSNIPYEKGAIFLRMLEENCGRQKFDAYLNSYFQTNAFKSMTTDKCIKFMDEFLFFGDTALKSKLKVEEWIFQSGLPSNSPVLNPERFLLVDAARAEFEKTGDANNLKTKEWSSHEWLQFLRKLNRPQSLNNMQNLDKLFNLSKSNNSEIAAEWYKLSVASEYEIAFPNMELFLNTVGRKKFLEPIYREILKSKYGASMANRIFANSKNNYHPLTALKIQKLLMQKQD
jgi:leukotriene-A4 hydrolase